MGYIEDREAVLKTKIVPQTKKADFEEFWEKSVAELRSVPLKVERKKLTTPYDKTFTTYEIKFTTHDDTIGRGLFSCPNGATEKLPCVAEFHGGSMKGEIYPDILATGVCCFSMDVRSQGGQVRDRGKYSSGDYNGGLMTRGVLDKNEYYMRNIFLDAVRVMDVIATLPEVDPDRIVSLGGSQGGALSIAASALSGRSMKCYTYVASYNCLHRRVELGSGIFKSTHEFLRVYPEHADTVFDTITYFDVNNLVSLLKVPTSFCIGLSDQICLPEFVYSVYTHAECEKELYMIPFSPHCYPAPYKEVVENELAKL